MVAENRYFFARFAVVLRFLDRITVKRFINTPLINTLIKNSETLWRLSVHETSLVPPPATLH